MILFGGLELDQQWASVLKVLIDGVEELVRSATETSLSITRSVSAPTRFSGGGTPGSPSSPSVSEVAATSSARLGLVLRLVLNQLYQAVTATLRGFFSYHRIGVYLKDRGFDLIGRSLCVVSLALSQTYHEGDYEETTIGFFHKEAVLSYTVIFLWMRQLDVLSVSSQFGSFVYMLGRMIEDVIRWFVIYFFCALAWAAGLLVLFRNRRAGVGPSYGDYIDQCENIEIRLGESFTKTFLFLFQVTLHGSGEFWDCVVQSGYRKPGIALTIAFLIIVVIMLLNTLIAMMAETFTNVTRESFKNYAYAFGKTLMQMRLKKSAAVPFNLLAVPFNCLRFGYGVTILIAYRISPVVRKACRVGRAPAAKSIKQVGEIENVAAAIVKRTSEALGAALQRSKKKQMKVDATGRDPNVIQRINDIRLKILMDPNKKRHFERSIARFCSVQVRLSPLVVVFVIVRASCVAGATRSRCSSGSGSPLASDSVAARCCASFAGRGRGATLSRRNARHRARYYSGATRGACKEAWWRRRRRSLLCSHRRPTSWRRGWLCAVRLQPWLQPSWLCSRLRPCL